ncbi:MAG TPA: hypothetical protein VHW23_20005 [Kofleriaceae bacterium]|nr:hypothetical protein [Kofleriaceae bacterium]
MARDVPGERRQVGQLLEQLVRRDVHAVLALHRVGHLEQHHRIGAEREERAVRIDLADRDVEVVGEPLRQRGEELALAALRPRSIHHLRHQ